MKVSKIFYLLFPVFIITGCGSRTGDGNQGQDNKAGIIAEQEPRASEPADEEYQDRGRKVYDRVCLVCHQSDGSGVPMMYPPIIESEYISGNTDSLILLILEGMSGPVVIKGEEYNSIMPPYKDILDDQEIADLINYLRTSFGNSGEMIKPGQVAAIREEGQ
jgi:mono/diheme cytochrome c family protein